MQNGDIIDVRIKEHCTRGACPVPPAQTLPNIHYLANATVTAETAIQESQQAPNGPHRITFTIRDVNGTQITLRMKKNTRMIQAMQAFAHHVQKEIKDCRFLLDGQVVNGPDTSDKVWSGA